MKELSNLEELRARLHALVAAKNFNMQDPDVLSLSMELDLYIVDFQKAQQRLISKLYVKEA
ncbi:MAG: Spo0E family sporulation regulatory protein-aspartic acid phosphatase [Pelosinus sp.]|nr:Spo0E family sporulation regulatory protein-aspartic acid phosphatase [Pelosinus sp.]